MNFDRRAMTLVEVLVAMGLTAVLGTLLVTFLMTSHRISVQELSRVSGREQLLSCLSNFRQDLSLSSHQGVLLGESGKGLVVSQRPEGSQWSGRAWAYRFDGGILRRGSLDESTPILSGKFKVSAPLSLSDGELHTVLTSEFPSQARQFQLQDWRVTKLDSRTFKLSAQAEVGQSSLRLDSVVSLRL